MRDWSEYRETLISGELADTYGGDYTFKDVEYEKDAEGNILFYESYWGAKPSDWELVIDADRVREYMDLLRAREAEQKAREAND